MVTSQFAIPTHDSYLQSILCCSFRAAINKREVSRGFFSRCVLFLLRPPPEVERSKNGTRRKNPWHLRWYTTGLSLKAFSSEYCTVVEDNALEDTLETKQVAIKVHSSHTVLLGEVLREVGSVSRGTF